MSGDIYDIMVKDLMARRQAEEDSDEDEDEDDSSDSDSSSEDEEDREVLKKKLAEDNEDDEDGSLIRERERKRQMEEAIRGAPAEEGEDENEQPKAKEVSAVLSMKAEGGLSPQRQYAIDRKWVSTSTLPPLPRQQPQPKETRASPNASTSTSPTSSGSSFLGLRKKDSKEEKTEPTDWKKRSKDAKEEESSACQDATGKVKMRKRDIIRGQWGNAFLSLREEKEEIKGKLNEWRSQRHDEKKEKETDKELRKRTKEEAKKKKREESEKKKNKDDTEWEKKDRKAAEAYAKRYGLDCTFDDRPRDGTKCYTSFGENESDDDDQTPLARAPQPPPLVGGRP